jgi:allophanate hydrolase
MPSAAPERGAATVVPRSATVSLAVVAAHRTGQPLHSQLLALGSSFVRVALTAPVYRLIALPGPGVPRGGIVATAVGGTSVEVELHEIPVAALGELLCALPSPLALGRVQLLDEVVLGMVCASTPTGSVDISSHRSWLRYLAAGTVPSG